MNRVVIIGTRGYPSYYGGFETAVRRIAPHLADKGWDVTVYGRRGAVVKHGEVDSRVSSLLTPGMETRSLSTLTYGFAAAIHAAIRKPDVALVMNVANGFWLPILKIRGIRTVVNVDGLEWRRDKWGKWGKRIYWWGARLTARYADRLIFDAEAIAEYWKAEFRRDGDVIPYGGDPVRDIEPVAWLKPGAYVLVVARLVPENTIYEFLKASEVLAERWPIVIVGSSGYGGPIEELLRNLTFRHPRISWLGQVSDDELLFALWRHCGVYFHGHSVGGTNPALVQAMACGAPVVARDTPYNREVLANGGILTEPDPDSITAAISEVIDSGDLRAQMSERARSRAARFYSWPDVCRAYEKAIRVAEKLP